MKAKLLETLYELSKKPYRRFFKTNEPWRVSVQELLKLPNTSLGFHLACFLLKHSFELQPKLESHDVYHVLTQTGISVPEEISMQYYLFGNGKRSIYLYLVITIGTLFYLNQFKNFRHAYSKGCRSLSFHQIDFSKLVHLPIEEIRILFSIQ